MIRTFPVFVLTLLTVGTLYAQPKKPAVVPTQVMQQTFDEVKTPYKYGLIMVPEKGKMIDCPSIFREKDQWYMSYIVFDGRGYETWVAKSDDLIHWESLGKLMSFTEGTWDANQKAGYVALQDPTWGGSYELQRYRGNYWMSYIGGDTRGYEAGDLGIGIAWSKTLTQPNELKRLDKAVLGPKDEDVSWWDNHVIYKSTILWDKKKQTGYPFVMYYNAKSLQRPFNRGVERIGMAVSDDMVHWKRFGTEPVVDHNDGITGDAQIARMGDLWVMFYFGAGWKKGGFDRFACSYDLVNWTKWEGEDLITPSAVFDAKYAHKPYVVKIDGVVYHYYNAVDKDNNRGLALATSVPIGKSSLSY